MKIIIVLALLLAASTASAHHHDHFVTIQPGVTTDYTGRFQEIDHDGDFVWFRKDHNDAGSNDRMFFSQFEEHYWWWRIEHGNDEILDSAYCVSDEDEHYLVLTCDSHDNRRPS